MQFVPNQSSYLYNQSNFDFNKNAYISSANKSLPPNAQIQEARNIYASKNTSKGEFGPVRRRNKCKYDLE